MNPELLQRLLSALLEARLSPADISKLVRETDWSTPGAPAAVTSELRKRAIAHREALLRLAAGTEVDLARIYRNLLAATSRKYIPSYLLLLDAPLGFDDDSAAWRSAYLGAYREAIRPAAIIVAARLIRRQALRMEDVLSPGGLPDRVQFGLLGHVSEAISPVEAFRRTIGQDVPPADWSEQLTAAMNGWAGPPLRLADLDAVPKPAVAEVIDSIAPAQLLPRTVEAGKPSLLALRQVAADIRSNGFLSQIDRDLLRAVRRESLNGELAIAVEYLLVSTGVAERPAARIHAPLLQAALKLLSSSPTRRLAIFAALSRDVQKELLSGRFLRDSATLWVDAGPRRRADHLRVLSAHGRLADFISSALPTATRGVPAQTLVPVRWRQAVAPFLSTNEVRRELAATPRRTRLRWLSAEQAKRFVEWIASPALPEADLPSVLKALKPDVLKWCYLAAGTPLATRAVARLLSRLDARGNWPAGNELWWTAHRRYSVPLATIFPEGLSGAALADVANRAGSLRRKARLEVLQLRARGEDGLAWESFVRSAAAGGAADSAAPHLPSGLQQIILADETAALRAAGLRPDLMAADVLRARGLWPLIATGVNYFALARWLDGRLTLEERREHTASIREAYAAEPATAVALEVALLASLSDAYLIRRLARQARAWSAERRGCVFDGLYRTYDLPKRSGGVRTITVPDPALKRLQRRIYERVLAPAALHPTAHGFRKDRSILTNARHHAGKPMVVSVDIESFFRSTQYPLVLSACAAAAGEHLSAGALRLLTDLCCYDGALPTGAPTSPALGNLVLRRADAALQKAASRYGIEYTRYADDLTFSGEADVHRILPFVRKVLRELGYSLKEKKVNIFRRGRRQVVTGLVVNEVPNLPRRRRRQLRAAVHRRLNGKAPELHGRPLSDAALLGHIGHLGLVKPQLAAAYRDRLRELAAAKRERTES